MNLLGLAIGILVPGGLIGAVVKFGAKAVFGGIGKSIASAAGWAAAHWRLVVPAVLIAAALLYALHEKQEARHWQKVDANDVAARHDLERVLGSVKAEVDRGVGLPTRADQAAFYVRRFVDNVNTLKGINAREEAGIRQSHADGVAARAGAHQDAQPTKIERERDKVRQRIADPARTTGLTADEWSQL